MKRGRRRRSRRIQNEEFEKQKEKEKKKKKKKKEEEETKGNLHRPSHRSNLAPDKGQFPLIFVSFEYLH